MAAKRTSSLIPLCHPLPLSHVGVELEVGEGRVDITASAETTAQTGVEMEALTAVAVAGLDRLRHGQGDRQGDDDHEITLVEKTKERRLRAAVLTVSDRVSRGEAEDVSGDTLEELLLADGFEVDPAARAGRARRDRARDRRSRRATRSSCSRPAARPRGARRDARGDAVGARARGARDRRGDPGRLDREDAARAALARRRRHGRERARRQPRRLARRLP